VKHRTTTRFWASYADLPEAIQKVAQHNFDLLKKILHILPCTSRESANCGL